jgi:DNA-binding response OmpR family regulator
MARMTRPGVHRVILIVEDDVAVGALLCQLVIGIGYQPALVTCGEGAIAIAPDMNLAAVIVDLLLPGIDGLTTTRELRAKGVRAPIVMVSANAAPADIIAGFGAGADEYIGKPFDVDVFSLKVDHVVKLATHATVAGAIEVGGIRLDPIARRAEAVSGRLPLTPLEFELLRVLMEHASHVVPLAELAETVWGDREVRASNAYHVGVQRLRRKLQLHGCSARIHSVRGKGYVLTPHKDL